MSTHAKWILWVGAKMGYIDLTEAPSSTLRILDSIADGEPYAIDGLGLRHIYMHGHPVGLGVEVAELSWTDEVRLENVFDVSKVMEATVLVAKVHKLFGDLGLHAQILVMHHIDFGG
ncbi:MAG: hypothetical protein ACM3NH_03185 [Candidatus Saccharibacteria bacterium]